MTKLKIIDLNLNNVTGFGLCGYKNVKQEGYRRKTDWLKKCLKEGMKVKILDSPEYGAVGMIEYVPGENAWRPVEAKGYMFIHCIFVVFKKLKGKGYGSALVEECLKDAKSQKMHGVAVVTRKGTWMAAKDLFLKLGFEVVDMAPPDFELLARKFKKNAPSPRFKTNWKKKLGKYNKGMTIICSDQCPYVAKSTKEINETARKKYGIKPRVVELKNSKKAQNVPWAFGVFGIIYNGKLVADHPISNTRFMNIMKKELK